MFPAPPRPPLPPPSAPLPIHVPVGAVVAFMGAATSAQTAALASAGWMICDGRQLSASMYPELFSVIGYLYSGDTQAGDTFLLPNLQGYFLRGVDPNGSVDQDGKGRTVGSIQQCALQNHVHTLAAPVPPVTAQAGPEPGLVTSQSLTGYVDVSATPPPPPPPPPPAYAPPPPPPEPQPLAYVSPTETRPVNVYVYYLVKFTTGAWPWAPPYGAVSGGERWHPS